MKLLSPVRAFQRLTFLSACAVAAHAGTITVTPSVTTAGSLFHYSYTVTNGTGNDMAVLDIAVIPGAGTIQGLATPSGFVSAYDSVLGLVSFLEDSSFFGPSPVSGFTFNSRFGPGSTTFTGTFTDGSTLTGATTGPVAALTAVPEPGTPALLAGALAAVFFWRRRTLAAASYTLSDL
jgi:hypothetical protein